MLSIVIILFCAVVQLNACCPEEVECHEWTKLNSGPVCFEARGNKPGSFVPSHHGFLTAVKLKHLSGYVTCARSTHKHDSNWGCKDRASVINEAINVFVTDKNNKVMFPKVGISYNARYARTAKFYGIQGCDSMSPELVLQHGLNSPSDYIGQGSQLRVWYGEDLFNINEGDNGGRVCVDVYGYFV